MHFPFHATNMPFRKVPLKATAWERHGLCELASAVQRLHVGGLPAFGTVGEGRVAAGERHGICDLAYNAAEERHGTGVVWVNRP
jgi:hypothetical protein